MRIWVRVHLIPPRHDAARTRKKPLASNCVDLNVNMKRPPEMSSTTRIRAGFYMRKDIRILFKCQDIYFV